MNVPKEIQRQMQELQILEQHLQNFLAQRQAIQIELNETNNALEEINKTNDEVYKMLSGVMIKADKSSLKKELEEKKKLLKLRLDSIEKQEKKLEDNSEKLREEVNSFMKKEKKS